MFEPLFRPTDAPAARHRQRIIEDVPPACRFDRDDRKLCIGRFVLTQILENVIQPLLRRSVDDISVSMTGPGGFGNGTGDCSSCARERHAPKSRHEKRRAASQVDLYL